MMDAKRIAVMQAEASRNAALRSGKGKGVRLLDDSDMNIGNAATLAPQVLPAGVYHTTQAQTLTNNSRLLNLTAESKSGQSITVVMTASRLPNTAGLPGPITGVIEFGNGAVTTKVEFDVPFGPYQGDYLSTVNNVEPQDSGAIIQVPTGVLRVFARYDNAFLTPLLDGKAYGGGTIPFPNPESGPFGPNVKQPTNVRIKAFATYFGRIHTRLYKTQYLYTGAFVNPGPVEFGATLYGGGLYCIPPFAKNVRLVRSPQTAAMNVTIIDPLPGSPPVGLGSAFLTSLYAIPSGPAPLIPIEGNDCLIQVQSNTPADTVSAVKLVYEIAF
jgi:hypothetical protein